MTLQLRRAALILGFGIFLPWPRFTLEAHMAVHMLIHLPAVALLGSLSVLELSDAARKKYAAVDWLGVASLTCFVLAFSLWMIPVALDASLLSAQFAFAKYASIFIAGAVLTCAWNRAPPGLIMFMLGNLAWMLATAGLLFMQAENRLCVSYLLDQQNATGIGLIIWAVIAGVAAFFRGILFEETSERLHVARDGGAEGVN